VVTNSTLPKALAQPELPPLSDNAVSSPRFRKGFFQWRFLPAAVSSSGGFIDEAAFRRFLPAAVSSGGFQHPQQGSRAAGPTVASSRAAGQQGQGSWFSPAGQHPRPTVASSGFFRQLPQQGRPPGPSTMSDDEGEPEGLDAAFDRLLEPDPELGPREPIRVPLRRNRAVRLAELAARFAARVRQRARVPPVIPGVPRRWAVLARRYCEFVAKSAQVWAVTRARVRWARPGRLLRRARWAIRYREENFVPRFVLTFVKRWKAL